MPSRKHRQPLANRAIAIEVGGYEAKGRLVAEGDPHPEIATKATYPSVDRNPSVNRADIPREERISAAIDLLTHLRRQSPDVSRIGIASTGVIDTNKGVVLRDRCR